MRTLLDVCTPRQIKNALPAHEVITAAKAGWAELENGDLLRAAEDAGYELFIACDKNIRYQQNLTGRRIAILELWTNHRPTLEQHFARIKAAAESMQPGEYRALGPTD